MANDTKTLTLTYNEIWILRVALRIRIHCLRDDIARYDLSVECKEHLLAELDENEVLLEKIIKKFDE